MNKIFAIIGPTGVGKSHLARHLVKDFGFSYIPSVTTRAARKEEDTYKHTTKEEFENFIERNLLLEYTTFDNNYYGKLIADVEELLSDNHCLYTLTTDRVKHLKERYPNTVVICLTYEKPVEQNATKRLVRRGHSKLEIENRLKTLNQDIKIIEDLQKEGLIDFLIETLEGDKKHSLKQGRAIVKELL